MSQTERRLSKQAMSRLRELKPGQPGAIFTSDLSVNEFLLVREAGFAPLGLVLGTSVYHVGLQLANPWGNTELDVLSQSLYHARELAMQRMTAEAAVLDADGIVGVRLSVQRQEWGQDVTEFLALGTAVRADSQEARAHTWRDKRGQPFTSDLSGQDFWTLLQTGYAPLGMVMGVCVYHVARRGMRAALRSLARNTELVPFTQALYNARELAMARMQREAEQLGADGVVGVDISARNHSWGPHTTEFFAVGTGVRALRPDHTVPAPTMVLGLDR